MTTKSLTADLVVLGGGGAGLAAALAAAENGCRNIIVLEKAGSAAGSTAMAHDVFGAESPKGSKPPGMCSSRQPWNGRTGQK